MRVAFTEHIEQQNAAFIPSEVCDMAETEKYPNAGIGCKLDLYRTGEKPQVGDKVAAHRAPVLGVDRNSVYREQDGTITGTENGYVGVDRKGPYFAARFDLISRAPSAPSQPETKSAEGVSYPKSHALEDVNHWVHHDDPSIDELGWACLGLATALEKVLLSDLAPSPAPASGTEGEFSCEKCKDTGKYVRSFQPGIAKELPCDECQHVDAPVITGPGLYIAIRMDRTTGPRQECEIVGKMTRVASEGLHWVGVIDGTSTAFFADDGECSGPWRIVGPYVPPPEPVLRPYTLVEAATLLLDKPVIRKGLLQYGPNTVQDICRKSVQIPYSGWVPFKEMATDFTFVDGSPCGVLVEP